MHQELPPEWRALMQKERQQALRAATNFAAVCARGDAAALYNASLWLDECVNGWRLAMLKVARLQRVSQQVQQAFVSVWVEHKMLPLAVADRPILAKALRVLMPGGYTGASLTLYRGAIARERSRRMYGFSWTTDITVARKFAEHWASPGLSSSGVLLQTEVLPAAVLLTREPEDYYDEGEVVVDPYLLGKVRLIETVSGIRK
jgi:hypothetical protein